MRLRDRLQKAGRRDYAALGENYAAIVTSNSSNTEEPVAP
jgi:hypothetical protein